MRRREGGTGRRPGSAELEAYRDHELIELDVGAGALQQFAAEADMVAGARPSWPLQILAALRVHGARI